MSTNKQARRGAIAHLKTIQQPEGFVSLVPAAEEYDHLDYDTEAAHTYVNQRLKPLRYASLARIMEGMFRSIFELDGAGTAAARMGNISETHPDRRWQALRNNTSSLLTSAARHMEYDPAFLDNEKLNNLKSSLTPGHISTSVQLQTGGDTYANAAIFLLRNIQPLARVHKAHAHETGRYTQLARNSFSIPWNLAMRSISQLVATECEMAGGTYQLIGEAAALWRANDIRLVGEDDDQSFVLSNPFNPIISPGTVLGDVVLQEPTPMQELPDPLQSPVIGCPITLIKDRFEQLWDTQVTAAVPLWAHDRPPYKL